MLVLGILQFSMIFSITLYEVIHKSSALFLWATLMFMFGLPHLISTFTGDALYKDSTLNAASIFVIVFCSLYLFFRISIVNSGFINTRNYFNYDTLVKEIRSLSVNYSSLLLILAIDIVLKIYPFIESSGGLSKISWGAARRYTSELPYLNTNQITTVVLFSLSGIILFYLLKNKYHLFVMSVIFYTLQVVITRNRIEVLPLLCTLVSIPIFKTRKICLNLSYLD